MEELSHYIDQRFDEIRDAHLPHEPYAIAKKQLFQAFDELAKNGASFPYDDAHPLQCPVCEGDLKTAYNRTLVCERCMQPVLNALDNLVRCSTTDTAPERLRTIADSYIDV